MRPNPARLSERGSAELRLGVVVDTV